MGGNKKCVILVNLNLPQIRIMIVCIRKVPIKPNLSRLGYSKIEKQNPMLREFLDHGVISPDEMYSRLYDIRFLNSRGLH